MANANPRLIVNGDKRVWEATIRVDGKFLRRRFRLKAEAERWLTQKRHDRDRGVGLVDDERLTVRQYAEGWFARQSYARDVTGHNVEDSLNRLSITPVGDCRLSAVLPTDIEAWLGWLKATFKPSTCRTTWKAVRALFRAAVRDKKILFSPCEGLVLRLPPDEPIVIPTVDEIDAIYAHLPKRWRAAIYIGARTGLRPGELLALCDDQLTLVSDQPYITVDRQLKRANVVMYTKTVRRYGCQVRIGPDTVDLLIAHMAEYPPGPDGRLFPVRAGNKAWPDAVAKAGITRHIRMHDLRHFYASYLLKKSHDWALVADMLGDSIVTVQRTYAHVVPSSRADVGAIMDAVFSDAATIPRHD